MWFVIAAVREVRKRGWAIEGMCLIVAVRSRRISEMGHGVLSGTMWGRGADAEVGSISRWGSNYRRICLRWVTDLWVGKIGEEHGFGGSVASGSS